MRLIRTGAVKHLGDPGIAARAARMWRGGRFGGRFGLRVRGGWKDKSRNNPIHPSKDVFFNWTEKNG